MSRARGAAVETDPDPDGRDRPAAGSRPDPATVAAWAATALGTALAAAHALVVPAGQPYDEPAHWSTVLFYADHWRMPEIGEPGATYEAQMGPGYYVPAAALVQVVGTPGAEAGFLALRLAGVLLVPLLALLTHRLALAVQGRRSVAAAAVGLVVLSPLVLATAGTVQNDVLTMVLATASLLVGARLLASGDLRPGRHALLGVLVGLAVLTKVVAVSLVPAFLVAYAVLPARRRLVPAGAHLVGVGLTCGWWFVRNVAVYGDPTGASALEEAGYSFPPVSLGSTEQLSSWAASVVSYVYVPVEYYRGALDTPDVMRVAAAGVALVTVGLLVARTAGLARSGTLRAVLLARPERVLVLAAVAAAVVFYVGYVVLVSWIAARLAFVSVAAGAVVVAAATRGRVGAVVRVATLVLYVAASAWMLWALARLGPQPFWLFPA